MTFTHLQDDERKANPRAAMVRVEIRDTQGYANQRRHDLRIGAQPDYVNRSPSEPNPIFIQPMTAAELKKLARERRAQRETQRAMKSNAGIAVVGIIGFGIEAQVMFDALKPPEKELAMRAAVQRIAGELKTTVSGLVLHLDETAKHAHFSLCGYDVHGEALSTWMGRGVLKQLQTALHEELRAFMPDLERGRSRKTRAEAGAEPYELVNRSVAELHTDLPLEIEARRKELAELEEKVRTNDARAEKARAKAAADEGRAEKSLKNAETYERRVQAARDEIEALKAKILDQEAILKGVDAAKVKAERERDQALSLAKEAESRAEAAEAKGADVQRIIDDATSVAAEAAAAVISGNLFKGEDGRWKVEGAAPAVERLKPFWKHLRPALERVAQWWGEVRGKVDALPDPERQEFFEDICPSEPADGPTP
jgi:DNA repair exonuclease SbcCD ATPase subunit